MRFELLDEVGSGAAGTVHRALDCETVQIVAVKVLHRTDPPIGELLLARKITHRNVCRVYDFYKEEGLSLFSMEFVEGETLKTRLERDGRLGVNEMLRLAGQMIDGLEEAHRCDVFHRDLKPGNIMITHGGCVKLMDFGMAGMGDPTDTFRDRRTGSCRYMAPEQSDLLLLANPRIDIYSLGVILHELVGGSKCTDLPPHIRNALFRCMQKDPAKRFRSLAELRDALGGLPSKKVAGMFAAAGISTSLALIGLYVLFQGVKPDSPVQEPVQQSVQQRVPAAIADIRPSSSIPVAVMPFMNIRKNPELTGLEDGIADALKKSLMQSGRFHLVERAAAPYWLIGSFMDFEGQIQMNARLVRAETAEVVFADSETAALKAAAGLPERIADRLVAEFKP